MMVKGNINLPNVSSLSVKYFKGVADEQTIEFTKNNKIVVLLGENGTGKSSFVNALEYLFRKKLDILKPSTVDKKSFIHKGHSDDDWEIQLNLGHENIKLNDSGCEATLIRI